MLTGVRNWLQSTPLSARLVAITAVLLAVGLGVTGAITQAYVSRYLITQIDEQLARTAHNEIALHHAIEATAGPSDYFVLLRLAEGPVVDATGRGRTIAWAPTVARFGRPDIPYLSPLEVAEKAGKPFTVSSTGGDEPAQWRVVALNTPLSAQQGLLPVVRDGIAFVALPLGGQREAAQVLARTLFGIGAGIVLLGGAAAWVLVRRSLRPLTEIETTAAAIASGDYSQRVPVASPRTELGSLGTSLNAMLIQIEQAFAAREESERRMRQFVADASHELRTPLATVRGYAELYRMGALTDDTQVADTMTRIEDSTRRMGLLVNDLLVLARLDEGRPLRSEPVNLRTLADDAARDLMALDPQRSVQVTGLDSLMVTGDSDRLRQVLTNLVGNVARYTPAGSPCEITVNVVGEQGEDAVVGQGGETQAVIEVCDHGPGVTDEQAARLFERFYRAETSRTRQAGGSGLGLAIVAAIIKAHGGTVTTHPTPGGGLTVHIELPTGWTSPPVEPG